MVPSPRHRIEWASAGPGGIVWEQVLPQPQAGGTYLSVSGALGEGDPG